MGFQSTIITPPEPGSGVFPTLVFVQGNEQRIINLNHSPYTVGRRFYN